MKKNESLEQSFQLRRLRLIIAIPALLLLFTIATGIINYQIVLLYEDSFVKAGLNKSPLEEISNYLIFTTLTIGALSVIFGVGLAYSITSPIKNITKAFQTLASGDMSRQVSIPNINEIGELGTTYNKMLEGLQKLFTERNKFMFESILQGMITTDREGTIITVNSTAEKILKITAAKITGKNILELMSTSEKLADLNAKIADVIKSHNPFEDFKVSIQDVAGHNLDLSLSIVPFRNQNNQLDGFLIGFYDLTAVDALQSRLRHADQLAAIGTFATGLAHEIRNPLCSVRSIAQMLRDQYQENAQEWQYTNMIVTESDRVNSIISQLLDFSHPDTSSPELCYISTQMKEIVAYSRCIANPEKVETVKLIENYSREIPRYKLQKDKFTQAMLNILNNAWEAVENNGTIEIFTGFDPEDPAKILISISDDGPPIPEEYTDKIFEPFFTTKDHGNGLGLAISYQIIHANGGKLELDKAAEKTTFLVKFPIKTS